jgi:hypothetical protein
MPSEESKYIVDTDLVIDSENRIIYYLNGFWSKGYVLPDFDSAIKFRKIGQNFLWIHLLFSAIFWVLFYMRLPIFILILLGPSYAGALLLYRYLKKIKPLKKYDVSDLRFKPGKSRKIILGSINVYSFWAIEIFFIIFLFLGLYTLVYKPEKWGPGLFLVIFAGMIAAFILYVIFLIYRSRAKDRPSL